MHWLISITKLDFFSFFGFDLTSVQFGICPLSLTHLEERELKVKLNNYLFLRSLSISIPITYKSLGALPFSIILALGS